MYNASSYRSETGDSSSSHSIALESKNEQHFETSETPETPFIMYADDHFEFPENSEEIQIDSSIEAAIPQEQFSDKTLHLHDEEIDDQQQLTQDKDISLPQKQEEIQVEGIVQGFAKKMDLENKFISCKDEIEEDVLLDDDVWNDQDINKAVQETLATPKPVDGCKYKSRITSAMHVKGVSNPLLEMVKESPSSEKSHSEISASSFESAKSNSVSFENTRSMTRRFSNFLQSVKAETSSYFSPKTKGHNEDSDDNGSENYADVISNMYQSPAASSDFFMTPCGMSAMATPLSKSPVTQCVLPIVFPRVENEKEEEEAEEEDEHEQQTQLDDNVIVLPENHVENADETKDEGMIEVVEHSTLSDDCISFSEDIFPHSASYLSNHLKVDESEKVCFSSPKPSKVSSSPLKRSAVNLLSPNQQQFVTLCKTRTLSPSNPVLASPSISTPSRDARHLSLAANRSPSASPALSHVVSPARPMPSALDKLNSPQPVSSSLSRLNLLQQSDSLPTEVPAISSRHSLYASRKHSLSSTADFEKSINERLESVFSIPKLTQVPPRQLSSPQAEQSSGTVPPSEYDEDMDEYTDDVQINVLVTPPVGSIPPPILFRHSPNSKKRRQEKIWMAQKENEQRFLMKANVAETSDDHDEDVGAFAVLKCVACFTPQKSQAVRIATRGRTKKFKKMRPNNLQGCVNGEESSNFSSFSSEVDESSELIDGVGEKMNLSAHASFFEKSPRNLNTFDLPSMLLCVHTASPKHIHTNDVGFEGFDEHGNVALTALKVEGEACVASCEFDDQESDTSSNSDSFVDAFEDLPSEDKLFSNKEIHGNGNFSEKLTTVEEKKVVIQRHFSDNIVNLSLQEIIASTLKGINSTTCIATSNLTLINPLVQNVKHEEQELLQQVQVDVLPPPNNLAFQFPDDEGDYTPGHNPAHI
eukprot:GDKK01064413.1.p1 GENE.GDKK01064413.1~~GDKK01064413.1.p1  ORF type:complete len:990 (+),score=308.15 GDKK01064413.1:184-2970(+)